MNVQYEDEYGEILYSADASIVPSIGDTILFSDEEYKVKNVVWAIEYDRIIVTIADNSVSPVIKEDNNSGRLANMNNAIIALNKAQDVSDKKHKKLTDEIVTIRKHINQRIQQDKKGN